MIYSLLQREFICNFFRSNVKINSNNNLLKEHVGNDNNESNSRDITNT